MDYKNPEESWLPPKETKKEDGGTKATVDVWAAKKNTATRAAQDAANTESFGVAGATSSGTISSPALVPPHMVAAIKAMRRWDEHFEVTEAEFDAAVKEFSEIRMS